MKEKNIKRNLWLIVIAILLSVLLGMEAFSQITYGGVNFPVYYRNSHRDISYNEGINAADYGFLPTNTGAQNVAAWNSLPVGEINICTDGVYLIDSTLSLVSNSTYNICGNVTFRKETGNYFAHILMNQNAANGIVRDSNITVDVSGSLKIEANGIDTFSLVSTAINPVLRLRGMIQLYKVDNFSITGGVSFNDTTVTKQFVFDLVDCSEGVLSDFDIRSNKDGLDLISCHDINVSNFKIYNRDDAIFVGAGYYSTTPILKDCYNINFSNLQIGTRVAEQGFGIRFYAGSWDTWTNGRSYSDYAIVNYNGHTYSKGTAGSQTASVAPTHTSGHVQGADGIDWWYVQPNTTSSVDVYNITVDNVDLQSNRAFCDLASIYAETGTLGNGSINNVTISGLNTVANYKNSLFYYRGFVDSLYLKHAVVDFDSSTSYRFLYSVAGTLSANKRLTYFKIDSSNITANGTYFVYIPANTGTVGRMDINNSTLRLSGAYFVNSSTGATFARLDVNNSILSAYNSRFIRLRTNVLPVINISNSQIRNMERLIGADLAASSTITLNNNTFVSPIAYVAATTITGCNLQISGTGNHWVDPTTNLFFNNQAGTTLNINFSGSTGTVTQSKVRNGTNVTITAFDLPYN
jgi:hypothetical protein